MVAQNIKVNPESIRSYGAKAQRSFDQIRTDLQIMVNATDRVPYEGENAEKFKAECGRLVGDFSKAMLKDMQEISSAVRTTTSNIAQALGGEPVRINVSGTAITPQPVKKGDGTKSADTVALRALPKVLETRFESIETQLRNHLQALRGTVWEGQGKKDAVTLVTTYTSQATKQSDEAKRSIIDYINKQLQALEAADAVRS